MDACVPSEIRPQCHLCQRLRTVRWMVYEKRAAAVVIDASRFIRFAGTCPSLVLSPAVTQLQALDAVCGGAAESASTGMGAA